MLKFSEEFELKTYQCNQFGSMKLKTLFDYFQELAGDHADKLGLGYEECISKNCAWVCSKYHVIIDKLPQLKTKISIETWPSKFIGPMGLREFIVKDAENNVLVKAVSQWVMVDLVNFKPVNIKSMFDCSSIQFGESLGVDLEKLSIDISDEFCTSEILRYDDVDVNHHVNNAVYISLIEDNLFKKLNSDFNISDIVVDFKKSAILSDDKILVRSNIVGNSSNFLLSNNDKSIDFCLAKIKFDKK